MRVPRLLLALPLLLALSAPAQASPLLPSDGGTGVYHRTLYQDPSEAPPCYDAGCFVDQTWSGHWLIGGVPWTGVLHLPDQLADFRTGDYFEASGASVAGVGLAVRCFSSMAGDRPTPIAGVQPPVDALYGDDFHCQFTVEGHATRNVLVRHQPPPYPLNGLVTTSDTTSEQVFALVLQRDPNPYWS